jgi:hypothetical protein
MRTDEAVSEPARLRLKTNAARVAVERLNEALAEQARLGDGFARMAGTSAEQSAYARLQAASLHVAECDRAVKSHD